MSFYIKIRPNIRNTFAGFLLVLSTGMTAQAQSCECLIPASNLPAGQAIGQLNAAKGQVNILGKGGWVKAGANNPIYVGSKVETGSASTASLSIGKCNLKLEEQSSVSIEATNQALCVAVANTTPLVNNTALVTVGIGLAAVGGIIAISTGSDKPVSQ